MMPPTTSAPKKPKAPTPSPTSASEEPQGTSAPQQPTTHTQEPAGQSFVIPLPPPPKRSPTPRPTPTPETPGENFLTVPVAPTPTAELAATGAVPGGAGLAASVDPPPLPSGGGAGDPGLPAALFLGGLGMGLMATLPKPKVCDEEQAAALRSQIMAAGAEEVGAKTARNEARARQQRALDTLQQLAADESRASGELHDLRRTHADAQWWAQHVPGFMIQTPTGEPDVGLLSPQDLEAAIARGDAMITAAMAPKYAAANAELEKAQAEAQAAEDRAAAAHVRRRELQGQWDPVCQPVPVPPTLDD